MAVIKKYILLLQKAIYLKDIKNYLSGYKSINVIESCVFENNTALESGVIYLYNPGDLIIRKSNFSNNKGSTGTSIFYQEECIFCLNFIKKNLKKFARFEEYHNK